MIKYLGLIPVVWLVKDEFYSIVRVRGDAMKPTYNKDHPISSWMEDDYVVVRKNVDTKDTRGKVVLIKDPYFPETQLIRRVIATENEWVHAGPKLKKLIRRGHCWVQNDNAENTYDSRSFDQIPLGLIQGEV